MNLAVLYYVSFFVYRGSLKNKMIGTKRVNALLHLKTWSKHGIKAHAEATMAF